MDGEHFYHQLHRKRCDVRLRSDTDLANVDKLIHVEYERIKEAIVSGAAETVPHSIHRMPLGTVYRVRFEGAEFDVVEMSEMICGIDPAWPKEIA